MPASRYPARLLPTALTAVVALGPLASHAPGAQPFRAAPGDGVMEEYVHEVWTVEDGLPVNAVTAVLQSRDGYLWLATFDGLVRFDGVRFSVYQTGDYEGLPSSRLTALVESGEGSLWMTTEGRDLVRYDGHAFHRFTERDGLPKETVNVLYVDLGGDLWVGTDRGVARYARGRFVPVAPAALDVSVEAILRDAAGTLWVGTTRHGLFRVSGDGVESVTPVGERFEGSVRVLQQGRDASLWVGTTRALYRWRGDELRRMATSGREYHGEVTNLSPGRGGRMWLGASEGVHVLENGQVRPAAGSEDLISMAGTLQADAGDHVWYALGERLYRDERLVARLSDPQRGRNRAVPVARAFAWDREGSLWIATNTDGLHRLKPSLFRVHGEPEGLSHRNVYPVYEDRSGAVWVGTWGQGISRIADGRIENFEPESLNIPSLVLSLHQDRRGRLWVGGFYGASRCELPLRRCEAVSWGGLPWPGHVWAIHEDRAGRVWVGADGGLYRLLDGTWERFDPAQGAPSATVRTFLEAPDGTLWMGTFGAGLAAYRAGGFTHITGADGLPSSAIRSLHLDAEGRLWVGTEGRGLSRLELDPTGGLPRITTYRRQHGLFDEVIHRILEDDFGRLWMSGNRGIFWVHRSELEAFARGEIGQVHSTAYTERDGLRNREANGGMHPAGIRTRDGCLWFPTQDGVVVVDPVYIRRNDVPPPVVIEQVVARERVLRADGDTLALAPGERNLEIAYTALSLVAPENVRFRYRLEGFDEEWVDVGGRRTAYYTNVPPGRYRFRVIASNNDGVWNLEGAGLGLVVPSYFYERAAFQALFALLAGLVVVGGVQWRLRSAHRRERGLAELVEARTGELRRHEAQLREQNERLEALAKELQQLDRAKSRFFANISHEFRTPLTLIIGPLEDIRDGLHGTPSGGVKRQIELSLRNARRLLRLINQILDVARLESKQLRLRAAEHDLASWLSALASAFAPAAERKRIKLDVHSAQTPLRLWFDPDLLEKVFSNLLANAVKFTPWGGRVRVSVAVEARDDAGSEAVVRVADSGPGISEAERERIFGRFYRGRAAESESATGTGIGLALARELTELHGGRIEVESGDAAGATFIVRLPLGRAHLNEEQVASTDGPAAASSEVNIYEYAELDPDPPPETPAFGADEDVTTVLVVDDSTDVRSYVRSHLAGRYRVLEGGDGEQGLAVARAELPDLVISDVMMPGTDGLALCRALKSDEETSFIPVILLTARAEAGDRIEGLEAGADDYVVKPFDIRELEVRVANLIESRRRLRERFGPGNGDGGLPSNGMKARSGHDEPTSGDAAWLERVGSVIQEHLDEEGFGVAVLARLVRQDRSHLYRRLRDLTGETPAALIRRIRLERAAELLAAGAGTVAEVAYAVGFRSVSHFCKTFRQAYGVTPATYARTRRAG